MMEIYDIVKWPLFILLMPFAFWYSMTAGMALGGMKEPELSDYVAFVVLMGAVVFYWIFHP